MGEKDILEKVLMSYADVFAVAKMRWRTAGADGWRRRRYTRPPRRASTGERKRCTTSSVM